MSRDKLRKNPTQDRSKDTVRVIVEGTVQVLRQQPDREPSMAAIARHAGVSVGSIYQYFASKEDLLDAALVSLYDRVFTLMGPALQHPSPDLDCLRPVYVDVLAAHQQDLGAFRFLRRRDRDREDEQSKAFQDALVERSVAMTVRAGRARDEDEARIVVTSVVRAMGGLLTSLLLYDTGDIEEAQLVESFVAVTTALAPPVGPAAD